MHLAEAGCYRRHTMGEEERTASELEKKPPFVLAGPTGGGRRNSRFTQIL